MYKWGHSRRFNAFPNYCVSKFGERLQKVAINAGFTCPNRDGTISTEGCYYCNNKAFNPSYCDASKSVSTQIAQGIAFLSKRYSRANKYLAYFQAYTNTYADIDVLKKVYDEALAFPNIVGIVVGTRADCVNVEILDFFAEMSEKKYVFIEFGLESCYNDTLNRINRGHSFEDVQKALFMTAERDIHTGLHLIFGLPGETKEQILAQTDILAKLPFNALKMHQLQIVKDTPMEKMYEKTPEDFQFFTLDEYIDLVIAFVERLNPDIVIDRFAGEVPPSFMAGPTIMRRASWGFIRNDKIIQMIEEKMSERNTWQGKYFIEN